MKRLLIFGDSIMRGVYYSAEEGRHKIFSERFNCLKERGFEVINSSRMGATVEMGKALVKKKLTTPAEDTTVIFEYGGNDCDFHWADISADPSGDFSPNTPADKFAKIYGSIISYASEMGAKVKLCNLVPLDSEKYVRWISRDLSYDNIISWLGDASMRSTAGTNTTTEPRRLWLRSTVLSLSTSALRSCSRITTRTTSAPTAFIRPLRVTE